MFTIYVLVLLTEDDTFEYIILFSNILLKDIPI